MLPLISVVLLILGAVGVKRLLPRNRERRRQVRFIRETLTANRTLDNRRVIASLSTVPGPDQQFDANDSIPSKANAATG